MTGGEALQPRIAASRAGASSGARRYAPPVSKAFTSEETPDSGPLGRALPRLAPGEARYVTPEGQAALRAALEVAGTDPSPAAQARAALLEATLAKIGRASCRERVWYYV